MKALTVGTHSLPPLVSGYKAAAGAAGGCSVETHCISDPLHQKETAKHKHAFGSKR